MLSTNPMIAKFEKKYVIIHGFHDLRHMLSNFVADYVENDPRAFNGGVPMEDWTLEFMRKYNIPVDNILLVNDIMGALDEEAWNY